MVKDSTIVASFRRSKTECVKAQSEKLPPARPTVWLATPRLTHPGGADRVRHSRRTRDSSVGTECTDAYPRFAPNGEHALFAPSASNAAVSCVDTLFGATPLQYLDGISVPEDVVAAANPLLVVNGRINMAAPDVGAGETRQIAAIEANHMVSTGRVNTRVGL